MLLYDDNNINSSLHIKNNVRNHHFVDVHQQNACARVKTTCLLYDAIVLARNTQLSHWTWRYDHAEEHPAIQTLCAFWKYFRDDNSCYDARIPYIQVFLDNDHYASLITDTVAMPVVLHNKSLQQIVKSASVIFGNKFLITFLAGRHITAKQSTNDYLIYYTVHNQPLFKERLLFGADSPLAFDLQNQLAWQTLKALHDFPQQFPQCWQALKKQREVIDYDIH